MTTKEMDSLILSLKVTRSKIKALREDEATLRDQIEEYCLANGVSEVTQSNGTFTVKLVECYKRHVDIDKLSEQFPEVYASVGNTITYTQVLIV